MNKRETYRQLIDAYTRVTAAASITYAPKSIMYWDSADAPPIAFRVVKQDDHPLAIEYCPFCRAWRTEHDRGDEDVRR